MAEKHTSDQPNDPAVPQERTVEEAANPPTGPRKRTTRAVKNTTAQKSPKAAKEAKDSGSARRTQATQRPAEVTQANGPVAARPAGESAPSRPTEEPGPSKPARKAARKAAKKSVGKVAKRSAPPATDAIATPAAVPPGAWTAAAWDAVRHLGRPPDQLAELAVADLGPRAAAWVGWLRETYPGAPAYGITRLAARQAARSGLALTALKAGGPLTVPVHLSATAWVRATLVLRIAAAHGYDPTDPRRAAELLDLLDLSPTHPGTADEAPEPGRSAGRIGLVAYALTWFRRPRRTPVVTAVRLLLAASEHSDSLDRLAHRAIRRYRTG